MNSFVVAHVDGVKPCGELIMFTVFANPVDMAGNDSAVTVWDVNAKKVYTMPQPDGPTPVTFPCSIKDPVFVEWLAKKTDMGTDLLLTNHYQGNDEYGYMGTSTRVTTPGNPHDGLYSVWYDDLLPQRPERVKATNWTPESGMNDHGNNYTMPDTVVNPTPQNGEMNRAHIWAEFFINAYAPSSNDGLYTTFENSPNGPWSRWASTRSGGPAWLRTEVTFTYEYLSEWQQLIDFPPFFYHVKREDKRHERWFTPFGLLGESPESGFSREIHEYILPVTTAIGIPHQLQVFKAPPEDNNFWAAKWEQDLHGGCASKKTLVYVAGKVFGCPVYTYGQGIPSTYEYPTDRVTNIHAVTVSVPGDEDAREHDYTLDTRNPALETELANLVNKACDINLMPRQLMPYSMTIETKILKK